MGAIQSPLNKLQIGVEHWSTLDTISNMNPMGNWMLTTSCACEDWEPSDSGVTAPLPTRLVLCKICTILYNLSHFHQSFLLHLTTFWIFLSEQIFIVLPRSRKRLILRVVLVVLVLIRHHQLNMTGLRKHTKIFMWNLDDNCTHRVSKLMSPSISRTSDYGAGVAKARTEVGFSSEPSASLVSVPPPAQPHQHCRRGSEYLK